MVIFGWRQTVRELATLMMVCRLCGMQGWQRVFRRITWFTLFFVPLSPVWVSWGAQCGTCGKQHKFSKAQADELVAQAATAPRPAH